MTLQVPTVDMELWLTGDAVQRQQVVAQVKDVCHQIGFFYLVNHGIPQPRMDQYMAATREFFSLPEEEKQKLSKVYSSNFRGWEKLGSELTNNQVDYREQLDIGPECDAIENPDRYYHRLVGPNQWPPDALIPGFRAIVTDFLGHLGHVSRLLLEIMSVSLGMASNQIQIAFGGEPCPYTKLIRYPTSKDRMQGVGTHKDSGFLTLLIQDDQQGLEAQSTEGEWFSIDPIRGSLVVNIGELLQMMTHNYFVATPHRVRAPRQAMRYSSAYFYSPDLDMPLDPFPVDSSLVDQVKNSPKHRDAPLMLSRAEMLQGFDKSNNSRNPEVFGVKYWERWVRSYPDIARRYHGDIVKD